MYGARRWRILVFSLIAAATLSFTSTFASDQNRPEVLVLNSYHAGFTWTEGILSGIRGRFDSSSGLARITVEYMDTKLRSPEELFPALADLYRLKYAHRIFDVIITTDNNAFDFVRLYRDRLFHGSPLVFCGLNDFADSMITGIPKVTGVVEDIDIPGTIRLALELHPGTSTIATVSDMTETDVINRRKLDEVKPRFADSVKFVDLVGLTPEDLTARLRELPQETIVLVFNYYRDHTGASYDLRDGMSFLRTACPFPLYSLWEDKIMAGALGGVVTRAELQGANAASQALAILDGQPISEIPVIEQSPNQAMFNYRQLGRHGLTVAALPQGAHLVNEPTNFFYRYKEHSIGVLVAVLFQALVIAFLWLNVRRRKHAERRLRTSQERYRALTELTPEGIFESDAGFRITYANQRMLEMFGYDRSDLEKGLSFDALLSPGELDRAEANLSRRIAGEKIGAVEYRGRRKDGTTLPILLHTAATSIDGTLTQLRGIVVDLSKSKRIERALNESETRYRALVDHSPNSIILIRDGRYVFVNPAGARMLGYASPEEAEGKPVMDSIAPQSRDLVLDRMEKLESGKPNAAVEMDLLRPDGSTITVESASLAIESEDEHLILVMGQDITDRKKAEQDLRETERRYQDLFEKSRDGYVVVGPDGEILNANEAYCRMLGYSLDELRDLPDFYCITPAKWRAWEKEEILEQRLLKAGYSGIYEKEYVRKDGTVFPVELQAHAVFDREGRVSFLWGIARDITERKAATRDREALIQRLEKAQQIGRLGDWDWDLRSNEATWSKGLFAMYGRDPKDGVPALSLFTERVHPEDREGLQDAISESIRTGIFRAEYRIARYSDDAERIILAKGEVESDEDRNPTRHIGTAIDITELRMAERALKASEERNRVLLENAGLGIGFYDLEGNCLLMNRIALQIMDATEEEVLGRNVTDLFGARMGGLVKERIQVAVESCESRQYEDEVALAHGKRWYLGTYTAISEPSGAHVGVMVIVHDITDRKLAEEQIRESEDRLKQAQRLARVGNWRYEIASGALEWSEELYRIYGLDPNGEVSLEHGIGMIHAEDRPMAEEAFEKAIELGIPYEIEYRICRGDGAERIVRGIGKVERDEDGALSAIYGTGQDITEQRTAEMALRESERRYHDLFNSVQEGIGIVDDRDQFLYVNPALVRVLDGETSDDLLGREFLSYFSHDQEDELESGSARWYHGDSTHMELNLTTPHGRKKSLMVWITPRMGSEGKYLGAVISVMDITETKRLRELESRAERLELAGTIAGQVAHDFSNLLAPLIAYPDFIREELPVDHRALAYLDDMENAARKIADINQDLLTMGRRGHYNHEPLDLNRLVRQVAMEIESDAEKLTCGLDLNEDLMKIKGGGAQIHRALVNLLINARDAMQATGTIRLRTENYYVDDTALAFGRVPRGEYVKLTISDTGCGIPDDILQRVFDPFFTTKAADRKRGSGLGLSVVDAVMKDHGGYIDLESRVGYGTSFYLYFPISRETIEARDDITEIGGEERIMVVDDDEMQRKVTAELLQRLGYSVTTAASGEEALSRLVDDPHDLVMLDMVMPGGIDGTETFRRIREAYPEQRAIILSGFSESERVAEAQRLGAGAFVRKPITRSALARAVRRELDRTVPQV